MKFTLLCLPLVLACAACAKPLVLKAPGVILDARAWNDVRIQDDAGKTLLTLTGFQLKWSPALSAGGGSLREITVDGLPALEIDYDLSGQDAAAPIKLAARLTPHPGHVDVRYEVSGLPDDAKVGGSMFGRRRAADAQELPIAKLGLWQRNADGGQPVEIPDGKLMPYRVGDRAVSLAFDVGNPVNTDWKDARSQHVGLVKSAAPGACTGAFSVLVTPVGWSPEMIAARWHGRPLGLHIGTDHTYNWWTDASSPLSLKASVANTSDEPRDLALHYWIRDFAGRFLVNETRDLDLKPGQTLDRDIRFKPAETRGIYFAEVSATDKKTGSEVFARTNLTLLPPHVFKSTAADSLFGIAAYWPFSTEADVQRVMERMGVRWLRNGDTHKFKDIAANHHCQVPWKITDPAERDAWIRDQLQTCVSCGDYAWEFGNEINYTVMSIGMGDVLKDQARARRVADYVQWLRDIRRVQKEMGPPATNVKLLSVGLAGMDVKFVQEVHDAGGWDLLDGLAIHPGRGNFTADYPVSEPWQNWTHGAYGNYWNYYGSIRTARELIRQYGGGKTLWLTEAYTCSFPNSFWEDSLRHGAENLVLSFALAKSEDVKAVMWYQLFDTVWHDKLGVNPKDREYYFGLIQRDLSFKPDLLAYCAIAEALDQAKFVRWLHFGAHSKTRGLLFDTPRGPMAVLWDRTDGYILTQKTKHFASPEPWTDTWRSHVNVSLPASGDHVTVINAIGQSRTVPAPGHRVTLDLTGAPVIVYGLDPSKMESF